MTIVIELRGAKKKIKMLRLMLSFRKENLKESEQVIQTIPKIKMGESKYRRKPTNFLMWFELNSRT